jgi:hypothetical protein
MRKVKLTEHICSCLQRRLTSRIGGWSDGRRRQQEGASFARQGVEDFARAVAQSWQQIRAAQVLWGSKRDAFLIWRGVQSGQTPIFAAKSPQREREKERPAERQKNPTPESNSNLFPRSAQLLPFHHPTPTTQQNTANMLIYKVRLSLVWTGCRNSSSRLCARSSSNRHASAANSTTPETLEPRADSTSRMLSPETR